MKTDNVQNAIWKLHRSTAHLAGLWDQIESMDGELPLTLEAMLTDVQKDNDEIRAEVVEGLKDLQAIIDLHDHELSRLRNRKSILEGRLERLKMWLATTLQPGEKWTNGKHTLSWRTSTSVEADVEKLQMEFVRVSYDADKTKLKEALAAGIAIEGARLVTKQNLQIR
jgi:hypothetical protein